MTTHTVGIIGAGKLGTALGRLAAAAGHRVLIHSRPNPMLDLVLPSILPAAQRVDLDTVLSEADFVILAIPHSAIASFDLSAARGIVIDATNPWEATDASSAHADRDTLTEVAAASGADPARVAKTLNHISNDELVSDSRIGVFPDVPRRAVAVVAENPDTAAQVGELVSSLGFDPVDLPADKASLFYPEGQLFGAWLSREDLAERVGLEPVGAD